ncbi:MAG: antibiotic biosynthesis monooxygenase [Acidobacteriota bacterium]|nr:antibiotic biosynthesis monooxygenase [Acidobacteriota bacterium]
MITRLFRLERDMAQEQYYDEVGELNLTTSVEVEPGTLAMYAAHVPDAPQTCYVFEVYADEGAYDAHVASDHFGAFVEMAGKVLTGREVIPVVPRLMLEKPGTLRVIGGEVEPHLVYVDVKPGAGEEFFAAASANMRAAVEAEPGVLVMYATTRADDPDRWVFWEVYASAEAYAAHREARHFKDYLAATESLIEGKEFHVLAADVLVSKGSLRHDGEADER